ncbi:MAG: hypothetical protein ACOYNJ_11305 [Candidatus Nanopelagicales bacterium]
MRSTVRAWTSPIACAGLVAGLLTVGAVMTAPAVAAADDPQTGCDNVYDSAVVGRTPIRFMRLVNEVPQRLTVSRTVAGSVDAAGRVTPAKVTDTTRPVWIGQKTPYMEGGKTLDYKKWSQRHSNEGWPTDHWWNSSYDRHHVGCHTNMPYIIGPGDGEKAFENTYDYEGKLYGRNDAWRGKGNWWAFPKRYEAVGQSGFSTWTCRGPVEAANTSSTPWWQKVDQGSGFFGDTDTDKKMKKAGWAPACTDSVLTDLTVRSYLGQTFYGNLDSDVRTTNRCEVSGASNAVGCWNELYGGPWARTWRQVTHVYGVALRASLQSTAQIDVPSDFRNPGEPATRRLSWVITKAETTGTWPAGSGGLKDSKVPTGNGVSPFTVLGGAPGRAPDYTIGTWGNINKREQRLTFRLTATTDGTWTWPVNPETGEELVRPSVDLTFKFNLNNFNTGGSCSSTSGGEGPWTANQPCIFGLVPTIFQVSNDITQNERRDPKLDDKGNPVSSADFKTEAIQGGWTTSDLKVQQTRVDWGSAGGAYVGANVKWDINLSGVITNLQ